jgi:hypothetical protein
MTRVEKSLIRAGFIYLMSGVLSCGFLPVTAVSVQLYVLFLFLGNEIINRDNAKLFVISIVLFDYLVIAGVIYLHLRDKERAAFKLK